MNETKSIIQRENFIQKFTKHKLATVAFIFVFLEILIVFLGPVFVDLDPYGLDVYALGAAPSASHLLGTDDIGRDILARIIYGGRISLLVGVLSTVVSFAIGIPLGLCAGYFRGKTEFFVMRAVDIFSLYQGW